jgi:hypothetical protein
VQRSWLSRLTRKGNYENSSGVLVATLLAEDNTSARVPITGILTLQAAVRISISSPLFNVIF